MTAVQFARFAAENPQFVEAAYKDKNFLNIMGKNEIANYREVNRLF